LNKDQAHIYIKEVSDLCKNLPNSISFEEEITNWNNEYKVHIIGAQNKEKLLGIDIDLKHRLPLREENNELTVFGQDFPLLFFNMKVAFFYD
jgi:hypothetical protein